LKPIQISISLIQTIVNEVIFQSRPLDKSFEQAFKHINGLNKKDKSFLFLNITSIIRYWILLLEIYKKIFATQNINFHKIFEIHSILEVQSGRSDGKLNRLDQEIIDCYKTLISTEYIRESYPQWLYNRCQEEIGMEWENLANVLNNNAVIILRTNLLKTETNTLLQLLRNSGEKVGPVKNCAEAIQVESFFEIFKNEYYKMGYYEVQDASSQKVAPFLDTLPGMRVVDACAGNGGKTMHLASLMQNKGKIIALDVAAHKLDVLKIRLKRAGIFNVEARHIDSSKTIKRLHGTADRLLLDVPCSGLGVLKRNPDIKYHLSHEKLEILHKTQKEILEKYSPVLSTNGIMVYSTCSILPSENQQQIASFLQKMQGNFELIDEQIISPLEGYDGFYMAKLKRCK
jgi:16S rRNA (cytosine967-C5)-methyltransferase